MTLGAGALSLSRTGVACSEHTGLDGPAGEVGLCHGCPQGAGELLGGHTLPPVSANVRPCGLGLPVLFATCLTHVRDSPNPCGRKESIKEFLECNKCLLKAMTVRSQGPLETHNFLVSASSTPLRHRDSAGRVSLGSLRTRRAAWGPLPHLPCPSRTPAGLLCGRRRGDAPSTMTNHPQLHFLLMPLSAVPSSSFMCSRLPPFSQGRRPFRVQTCAGVLCRGAAGALPWGMRTHTLTHRFRVLPHPLPDLQSGIRCFTRLIS